MSKQRITISLADQNFAQTASVGVYNVATRMAQGLAALPEIELTVLNTHAAQVEFPGSRNLYFDEVTKRFWRRLVWDQWGLYREANRTQPDWLFLPKGYLSFVTRPPGRTVAYVHDLIFDEFVRERIPGFPRFKSWYFRACTRAALRWATAIATNSEFTRGEILKAARRWGYPDPLVRPIGIGFDPPPPPVAKAEHILVLVSRWPNKDTPRAIEYLTRWERDARYGGRIVCVGSLPGGVELPVHWRRSHRLPRAEFCDLLASARAMVYFTRSEGFGMPPVEAVLQGTAPVFSAIPATEEVMLGAGFPFARTDYDSFVRAMRGALGCPAPTLSRWAAQLHERHRWERVLDRFLQLLQEASDPVRARRSGRS